MGKVDEGNTGNNWLFWVVVLGFLFFCFFCRVTVPNSSNQSLGDSPVYIRPEGGEIVAVPTNLDEDGVYTIYTNYPFGQDKEYPDVLSAAQSLLAKLGNRTINIYCDDKVWVVDLQLLIDEYQKDVVLGIPKESFCRNGGNIETFNLQK